jgi:hypothetical protein
MVKRAGPLYEKIFHLINRRNNVNNSTYFVSAVVSRSSARVAI